MDRDVRYRVATVFGGAILLLAFVAFTVTTKTIDQTSINGPARHLADFLAGGWAHPLFAPAEVLASPVGSTCFLVILMASVWVKYGAAAAVAVLVVFGLLTGIEGALRIRLDRLPWDHIVAFVRQPRGWHLIHSTYPSGHVARLALLAGVGAAGLSRRRSLLGVVIVGLVTAWVSLQRVESRSHTGVDVIGAALLGWGLALFFAAALPTLTRMRPTRTEP